MCIFDTPLGPMALVLVGATIVGSMATVWHGQVVTHRHKRAAFWDYSDQQITLRQGDEMGRFCLAPPWCCCLRAAPAVEQAGLEARALGQAMAQRAG